MDNYFSTRYGLVTDNDITSENGQLFLSEYILLEHISDNKNQSQLDLANNVMIEQLKSCETGVEGLYHRNLDLTSSRILSHDNLTGIMSWSYLEKTQHRFKIWKYLVKHLGTYDNSQGKTKQLSRFLPFNPGNFFVWGLMAESLLAYIFLPFYIINLLITLHSDKKNTSGKILTFMELRPLKDSNIICKILYSLFDYKMKKQYGENYITELMRIYHGANSKKFPINKLLGLGV